MATYSEDYRVGSWTEQAISKLNPGQGINFVVSGKVSQSLEETGVSEVNPQEGEGDLYLVGLGLRKEGPYRDALLTCQEVWIPFEDTGGNVHRVVLKVEARTSYPNWIYLWTLNKTDDNKLDRSWMPGAFMEEDAYTEYPTAEPDFDYSAGIQGPGGILFIPYIHPNYLTTDDYNGILGNVMQIAEAPFLYSILRNDVDGSLKRYISPNLRYKNYIQTNHKDNAIGSVHTGEFNIPGGDLSRVVEQSEYFNSFRKRAEEFGGMDRLQTLDLSYMSYRAISASVYVDRFEGTYEENAGLPVAVPIEKVWEDLQGGNTDDPETVYFVNKANIAHWDDEYQTEYIQLEKRTTIPVVGSILFKMDGHLAVRFTKATLYAPFLNTVYRTGEYGEVIESFTSQSLGD